MTRRKGDGPGAQQPSLPLTRSQRPSSHVRVLRASYFVRREPRPAPRRPTISRLLGVEEHGPRRCQSSGGFAHAAHSRSDGACGPA